MGYAVGIDLGTTNSVVAVYRRGVVETLSIEGRTTLPSVISVRDDGSILVGKDAKARMVLNPESTVASVKRFIGDRGKTFRIGRKTLSPVDISSLILRRIVEGAKQALGEEVWDAVITVPAYFNEAQREDTRRAGEEAGLNVLRLIPEPTAAAIAYGLDKGKDQTVMVYDLGGGTFDVSIMSVRGNRFDVKAVGGDNHLGGDDFDEVIMNWAADKFKTATGKDVMGNTGREGMAARQRLKEAAEDAKKELSEADTAHIAVPDCLGSPLELELTLAEYNRLIDPLLQRTVQCMRSVLADARLKPEDIGRVILVGGSTKNRAVREIVAREIKEPFTSDRVDEVVAHGAAYLAANLFLPDSIDVPIEMTNVTAHSLGIDALGEDNETLTFQVIIPRQMPYPCRQGFLGSTNRPNQDKVIMRVFRGEDADPEKNFNLGELMLPVTPSRHGYLPIGAVFELDADGIIHFTAIQLPADNRILPILEYAKENNEGLHLKTVDALLESGEAQSKTAHIKVK